MRHSSQLVRAGVRVIRKEGWRTFLSRFKDWLVQNMPRRLSPLWLQGNRESTSPKPAEGLATASASSPTVRAAIAAQFGVVSSIHPDDFIFQFVLKHPNYPTDQAALQYYFANGRQSAEHLKSLISESSVCQNPSIFEFASGYGQVSRHLRSVFPDSDIIACDIHPAAVDFVETVIGIEAVQSVSVPEDLVVDRAFDVVFALSFFSHMPKRTWERWLRKLAACAAPDGLIIFTTHGLRSMANIENMRPKPDKEGFWFHPHSEQEDLDASEYGTTVTTFDYVYDQIRSMPGVHMVRFQEGFWWKHQDLYVLLRSR